VKHALNCLVCAVILAAGCSSTPVITGAESEAEKLYRTGVAYLDSKDYEDAQEQFLKVIADYSYSKWEPFARIGLADTHFMREEFAAAFEIYKLFLQMRPNHELADRAAFQLGNCTFEQRPSDFWLLPPAEEKDLSDSVEKAAEQYRDYLKNYPQGKFVKETQEKLAEAESMLLSRELAVAEFYAKKDRCPAVKMRLKYITDHYTVTSEEMRGRIQELSQQCPGSE